MFIDTVCENKYKKSRFLHWWNFKYHFQMAKNSNETFLCNFQTLCHLRRGLLSKSWTTFLFPDSVSAFSSMANNEVDNKRTPVVSSEMEYWNHQHQWLDTGKLTTTTDSSGEAEELIPIFKKEANTTIITSAGQTVYLHCHVENLGERSVSSFVFALLRCMSRLKALCEASRHENSDQDWKIN